MIIKDRRQYAQMLASQAAKLRSLPPADMALRTGAAWEAASGTLRFRSFGKEYALSAPDWSCPEGMDMWHHLTVLQYLERAPLAPPSGEWASLPELADGGLVRGASFDREIGAAVADSLGGFDAARLAAAAASLGGAPVENAKADLCADFAFMPRYMLRFSMWFADDEFPASGKVLVNGSVKDCLGVEATGTVCELLIRLLREACG